MNDLDPAQRVAALSLWQSPDSVTPISGGITNVNFVVVDRGQKYFVRIGEDMPVHQIMRFNELAASQAAHAAGLSPKVLFTEPGVMVLEFIEGKTLSAEDVRHPDQLPRIIELVRRCHREVPTFWRGPALLYWVFQVIRHYAAILHEDCSQYHSDLKDYLQIAEKLERTIGAIDLVFSHNDLLPANFIDDGDRLWLIDYDYAGFGSSLFDLGGLASNNEFDPEQETHMLETYFDKPVTDELFKRYLAMKCASLLREAMWSMASEIHSTLDVDYVAYTTENLSRFRSALADFDAH